MNDTVTIMQGSSDSSVDDIELTYDEEEKIVNIYQGNMHIHIEKIFIRDLINILTAVQTCYE